MPKKYTSSFGKWNDENRTPCRYGVYELDLAYDRHLSETNFRYDTDIEREIFASNYTGPIGKQQCPYGYSWCGESPSGCERCSW